MKPTARLLVILCLAIAYGPTLAAQGTGRQPLEGVWKVTEIVVTGPGAGKLSAPQPSLFIFAKTHYSMMYVPSDRPRSLSKAEELTDAEKIAAYDSFVANTGTYEVSGSTLTIHPIVARSPNYMAGGFDKYQIRVDGNTLTLTEKSTDQNLRIGQRVVPSKGPASDTRFTLVRVE